MYMSHPELNQLTRAEQLFDEGKLEKALEILNDWSQFEGLNPQQKSYFQFLKGMLLVFQHKNEEVIKLGVELLKEGQILNENLKSFDGLHFTITGLCQAEKFDKAFQLIEKAEALFKLISNIPKNILLQREVRLSLSKAWINMHMGNVALAEKYLQWIFSLQKELGNTFEIVWANTLMGQIMVLIKSRFDLALEYFKKALSLAKKIKFNHYWVAMCHGFFGIIYNNIGELDNSIKHYLKALKVVKGFKSDFWESGLLNNIGYVYCEKGEYDLALEYMEESLLINEVQSKGVEESLDSIISVALKKGDNEYASKYFNRLENIYNKKKDSYIEFLYNYNKALILKRSSRIRDKVKAEELLKLVVEKDTLHYDIIINAYIHLCDLLLSEFRINNNCEVLDEINHYITQLLTIAEKSHSYRLFCEIFILQAKLALLNLNFIAARRFLTQAQKIAEYYGIKRLSMKISHEHDELLIQLKMWENLKESDAPLSERWKLTGLNNQMENMVRKRMIEAPKLLEEEPVTIFIITEGGTPLFSHSFIEEKSLESHLFGGFLTTIDYFVREMFSEGLDRAIFGDYTLLMKSVPPFFISYIFKGNSYYAYQKISYFIDHIQMEDTIWQNLLKSFQINQSIRLKDIPSLDHLINDIFVEKTLDLKYSLA